jgi:hypothetical protein
MITRDMQKLLDDQRRQTRHAAERLRAAIRADGDVVSHAQAYLAALRSYRRMALGDMESDPSCQWIN